MLFDRGGEQIRVQHGEDFEAVRHLHGGGARIAVTGDDLRAQALGGDGEFPAQLARTQEEDLGGEGHGETPVT